MKAMLVLLRYVSRPELAARPVRCLLMAGTVAVGVALMTAMHVATQSIVEGFADDLERLGGSADLQVTFGTGEAGFPEELLAKVAAMPFTAQAAALVRSQVTFEEGERETVELFGIDLLQEDVLDLYKVEVLEREKLDYKILDDPRGVFVTETIARERSLAVGSKVRLSAVDGVHDYTVRGIVAARGLAGFLDGRLVAMYLPAAQPVAGKRGDFHVSMIDQIDVRLKPGSDPEEARAALNATLDPGFHADTPLQRRVVGLQTVDGLRATLVGMSTLALLAAIFIIHASTTTLVVQRLPAMATLVTVGAGPTGLVRTVVAEAALLGAAGAAAGTMLGLFLASFIGEDAAAGMGLNYSLPFDSARSSWNPLTVFVLHPLGGVLVAACSAWLPARRLKLVTPLRLQHHEDAVLHGPAPAWPIALAAAALPGVLGVLALAYGVRSGLAGWVSAGGILVIAASVLATIPVLRWLWQSSVWLLARWYGVAGRIAGENLVRSMSRTLVTASAITLSVAIAVGAGSLVRSFRESVSGWYGFSGDVLVTSRSVTGGWLSAPVARGLEHALRVLPASQDVQTLRVLQGEPYAGERIAVVAMSDGMLEAALDQATLVAGVDREEAARLLLDGQAAMVSRNFVSHFGWTGDEQPLRLSSVTGEVPLPVVAVVSDYVSDKGSVLLARDLFASRWKDDLVNYYAVDLADGSSLGDLARDVEDGIPGHESLAVTPTHGMVRRVDGLIGKAFADIDTIKLLVLFLTVVGIADLVVSNVFWRRRELAALRLVGLTDTQVVRTARIEALCVAGAAALCGALVGTLCAWVWVRYNYPVLVGYVLDLHFSWGSILASFLLAAAAAYLAASAAARYALKQPALVTVRFE
ncbi:MAG: ABC transporter permease [Candidatus Binatia bacterium]